MRATSQTRTQLILALTALMTPMALWGLSGLMERYAQQRRRRHPNFYDPSQLEETRGRGLRNQVAAAGRAGQWRRVIELIDATYGYGQDCPPVLVPLRAEAKWRLGKRQGAVQDWASLLDPSDETTRAVVLALSGDREGYAAYAKQLLARPTVDGLPANNRAWALVLLPHAVEDYTPVIALAKKGVAAARGNGERALYLNTLGAAYLRAENYLKAREVFLESEHLQRLSTNWPLLALCYQHLGQTEESQRWARDLTNHLRRTFGGQDRARYELLLFQEELTLVEKKHL